MRNHLDGLIAAAGLCLVVGLSGFGACSPLATEPECQGEACCPDGFGARIGTEDADELLGDVAHRCLVGLDGADRLHGGFGPNVLVGGFGDDEVIGGTGSDVMLGGPGDDSIQGGLGPDAILPGPGADLVDAGPGADRVTVLDRCELVAGEVLQGGPGRDVLELPSSLEDAEARGVEIDGFEEIVVDGSRTCESDCTPPCSRVPASLADLPDPTGWSASGATRFRRTTAAERDANLWQPGAVLVEAPDFLQAARRGDEVVKLELPTSDGTLRPVIFQLEQTRTGLTFIERRLSVDGLVARPLTPNLHTYVNEGVDFDRLGTPDGVLMRLVAGSDGGVAGGGVLEGVEIQVDAGPASWWIEDLGAPGDPVDPTELVVATQLALGPFGEEQAGECDQFNSPSSCGWLCLETQAPCGQLPGPPPPVDHCSDGTDNDGDERTDSGDEECIEHPDPFPSVPDPDDKLKNATWGCDTHPGSFHSHRWEGGKSFALFGEGRFCAVYQANWIQKLSQVGVGAENALNQSVFNYAPVDFPSTPDGENRYRYLAGGCWIFEGTPAESLAAATACSEGGPCEGAASGYPYANARNRSSGYYDRVWDDVDHGTAYGLDDVLHLAQVVYYGSVDNQEPFARRLECGEEGIENCCGAAPVPFPATDFANLPTNRRGTGVTQYLWRNVCTPARAPFTAAHEIGHAIGLVHELSVGYMNEEGVASVDVGEDADNNDLRILVNASNQGQVWECLESWDECPRPSGFRYSGD